MTTSQRSSGVVSAVRDAVALRAWALAVLGGHEDPVCPEVSAVAWSLFLEGERCALPLRRLLEGASGLSGVPEECIGRIRMGAAAELARVESARRHLRVLGAIGQRCGWPVVVFKGAALAFDPDRAVDMEDVDVLVHPDHVYALAAELKRTGYVAGSGGGARHIHWLSNGDLLSIEVHFALDFDGGLNREVWDSIHPSPDHEGLRILAPADHAWLILRHIVVEHPNRRTNIRELLLMRSQLSGSAEVLRRVEQRLTAHPEREALGAVLREVVTLDRGKPPSRAFARDAAATYTVRCVLRGWKLPAALMQWSYSSSFAILLGSVARRGVWRRLLVLRGRSQYSWLARLEDRYPAPGMVMRLSGRLVAALTSLVIALPVSAMAIIVRRRVMSEH